MSYMQFRVPVERPLTSARLPPARSARLALAGPEAPRRRKIQDASFVFIVAVCSAGAPAERLRLVFGRPPSIDREAGEGGGA